MSSGSFKLEGNTPTVTWADPKSAPDSAAAAQVNFKKPMTFCVICLLDVIETLTGRGINYSYLIAHV